MNIDIYHMRRREKKRWRWISLRQLGNIAIYRMLWSAETRWVTIFLAQGKRQNRERWEEESVRFRACRLSREQCSDRLGGPDLDPIFWQPSLPFLFIFIFGFFCPCGSALSGRLISITPTPSDQRNKMTFTKHAFTGFTLQWSELPSRADGSYLGALCACGPFHSAATLI